MGRLVGYGVECWKGCDSVGIVVVVGVRIGVEDGSMGCRVGCC